MLTPVSRVLSILFLSASCCMLWFSLWVCPSVCLSITKRYIQIMQCRGQVQSLWHALQIFIIIIIIYSHTCSRQKFSS